MKLLNELELLKKFEILEQDADEAEEEEADDADKEETEDAVVAGEGEDVVVAGEGEEEDDSTDA